MPQKISIQASQVDLSVREYLLSARREGETAEGVLFVQKRVATTLFWLITSLLVILFLIYRLIVDQDLLLEPAMPFWFYMLLVAGVFIAAGSFYTWSTRRYADEYIGDFILLDTSYWWDVSTFRVEATSLKELEAVQGYNHFENNAYQQTSIELSFPGETVRKTFKSQETAEKILAYLQFLIFARREIAQNLFPVVPDPAGESSKPANSKVNGRLLKVSAAALATLVLLPVVRGYLHDHALYRNAMSDYAKTGSATPLRGYLADADNTLFRTEVQDSMNALYDRAIHRLEERIRDDAYVDRKVFRGLVAILNGLKFRESSTVGVTFSSRIQDIPNDQMETDRETHLYSSYIKKYSDLRAIEKSSKSGRCILELGETFSEHQMKRREAVILQRLSESLGAVVPGDIILLTECSNLERLAGITSPPGTCAIDITYHTYPSGSLYLYTQSTSVMEYGRPTKIDNKKVAGLLRGYAIDWQLRILPPGSSDSTVITLYSEPLSQLKMESQQGDPEWAPYSVLMYSAFHDFANNLVVAFGLPPHDVPDKFSFIDATGNVSTPDTYGERDGLGF